ncbi:MAG: aspartate/glutamate racemase family protein [Granulosicoccus sp.]|nr:aspartate/glutamate racemase family protein [Granulosicoccus sp.]
MTPFGTHNGGKSVYSATVGILMLDARFPRIPGDMGNALTWPFPVQYRIVKQATPERAVLNDARELLVPFKEAGQSLIDHGCDGITTNCGFLSLLQKDLQQALPVPVVTSALMQVPWIQQLLPPDQQVGVLTISEKTLTNEHRMAAGMSLDTPVVGTDNGIEFTQKILGNQLSIDFDQCEKDLIEAADILTGNNPGVGAIVLECTNMVPFAASIRRHTGKPVYSIFTLVQWFQQGLMPQRFAACLEDSGTGSR